MDSPATSEPGDDTLSGGGEAGALLRAIDWTKSPLGPVASWPASLRTVVRVMLASRFGMRIVWGPEFTFLYNDGYRPILGAQKHPGAMGSRTFESFREVWPVVGPLFERVYQGEAVGLNDTLLPLERNGFLEDCYFTLSYSPIRDEHGAIGGLLGVVYETTQRVLGERRTNTLRRLAAAAADPSTVEQACARAAAVLRENPSDVPYALLYVVEGEEVRLLDAVGRTEATGLAPVRVPLDAGPWSFAQAADTRNGVRVEGLSLRVDGLEQPIHTATVFALRAPGGEAVHGFLVMGASPRCVLDDGYRGFFELACEHVASGLSNALARDEAQRRAAALLELDRQKTAFFNSVSHEFRTPLTLMLGPLEDALATPERALHGEDLALAHRNARRLLKLVNALLDFSRVEAGRMTAAFEPVDLGEATRELAGAFQSLIDRAGLRLEIDCPPLRAPAFVDRGMWDTIVLNLVSNAFKFTFEGTLRVRVMDAVDGVELRVEDTGVGIPAQEIARLFERYHRVEGARSRTYEGSGIGLALVRELVELHGGTIRAESTHGQGSTFIVRLKRGMAHLPAAQVVQAGTTLAVARQRVHDFVEEAVRWMDDPGRDERNPRVASGPDSAPRILVADDNADMRQYIARLLAGRWRVQLVSDGTAALAAAKADPPDLVVSDVMMPGLDGAGLVRALRADPRTRTVPIILLSARAGEEAVVDGIATGANDFIVKPFSARDLLVRVASQLALAQVATEAARAAESERRWLYDLFMQAPMPIAIVRGERHVMELANPAALTIWGKKPEILGKTFLEAFPEMHGQGFDQLLRDVITNDEAFHGDEVLARLERGNAQLDDVYFNFVYAPLREADPARRGVLVCGFEVTAQVLARRRVEALVAELGQQKQDLEQAGRVKDEFLSTMSHELRTPLNAILGWTRMLRAGNVARDRMPRVLETIERNARAQTQLIDDLLDLSRIITGRLRLTIASVDLPRLTDAALETVRPAADARGITLVRRFDPRVGAVRADGDRMGQVLANLLSNALKFTPADGRVEVHLEGDENHVRVRVRDSGTGIDPEFLPHVFERFRQGDQTITRRHGGVGLGLSIVKNLVELHGGTVAAASAGLGHGAEFVVTLPVARVSSLPPRETTPPVAMDSSGSLAGLRTLVVDDEPDARELVAEVLSHAGAEVRTSASADEAMATFDAFDPDVLVSDIGMPDEDGYSLIARIRALPDARGRRVRAAAVTAYARAEDRKRALDAGFDLHLAKPIDPGLLITAVARLTRRPVDP